MPPGSGPKMVISTTRPAPVAGVLPSKAMAVLLLAHEPGTDDDGEQQGRPRRLGDDTLTQREALSLCDDATVVDCPLQTIGRRRRKTERRHDPQHLPTIHFVGMRDHSGSDPEILDLHLDQTAISL